MASKRTGTNVSTMGSVCVTRRCDESLVGSLVLVGNFFRLLLLLSGRIPESQDHLLPVQSFPGVFFFLPDPSVHLAV